MSDKGFGCSDLLVVISESRSETENVQTTNHIG